MFLIMWHWEAPAACKTLPWDVGTVCRILEHLLFDFPHKNMLCLELNQIGMVGTYFTNSSNNWFRNNVWKLCPHPYTLTLNLATTWWEAQALCKALEPPTSNIMCDQGGGQAA